MYPGPSLLSLNDDFGEILKFRPGSKNLDQVCCVYDETDIFLDSSLVLVETGCPHLKHCSLSLSENGLLAGSRAKPAALYQVGDTLLAVAASMPLLVWVSLWLPIMFPFAWGLLVPLDCNRSTCMSSYPAAGRRLLCPTGEHGGRRAGKST